MYPRFTGSILGIIGVGISVLLGHTFFHWREFHFINSDAEILKTLISTVLVLLGWMVAVIISARQI